MCLALIAEVEKQTPADVWFSLISERFLARLAVSKYRHHFVLKSGVLLARYITIGRETRDLDFSVSDISSSPDNLGRIFTEITQQDLHDGFTFGAPLVSPLEHFHMKYPGVQIRLPLFFGKSRFGLAIDLGFGERVVGKDKEFTLLATGKGPLFEASIHLSSYPIEYIFAEKLETACSRGGSNSRMKDYHDLYSITTRCMELSLPDLARAIAHVFHERKSPHTNVLSFDELALNALQNRWTQYLKGVKDEADLPEAITEVIKVIASKLGSLPAL